MNKEQYLKKQSGIEYARQVRKETNEKVSAAVDEFFIEQKVKQENYVPQKLVTRKLPVGLYVIRFEDGIGNIPDVLSGTYTTIHHAEQAIARYVAGKYPDASTNTN